MSNEQITEIIKKVAAGEGLTHEEASTLIEFMAAIDQRGVIAENVVEFVLSAAEEIYNDVARKVSDRIQLRDKAKVKEILGIGKTAANNLTAVTQLYIAQVFAQLQNKSAVADADPDVLDNSEPA